MFQQSYTTARTGASFMHMVYAWMAAALAITAITAYGIAMSPQISSLITKNPFILIFLFIVQIGLVIGLSASLMRISFSTAVTLFLVYAFSVGITFSLLFKVYTMTSLATTFMTAAGMFGGMALYGYFTKTDLTGVGNIALMMVWGLIIALLVNMWFANQTVDLVISVIGVIVFSLLTAYDTQKIKHIAQQLAADEETVNKIAVIGALTLYLDFINLFIYLLRFMGQRRQD